MLLAGSLTGEFAGAARRSWCHGDTHDGDTYDGDTYDGDTYDGVSSCPHYLLVVPSDGAWLGVLSVTGEDHCSQTPPGPSLPHAEHG